MEFLNIPPSQQVPRRSGTLQSGIRAPVSTLDLLGPNIVGRGEIVSRSANCLRKFLNETLSIGVP